MKDKIANTHKGSSSLTMWIAGGAALALAVLVARNFASIRRYIRIEMM
jgi:hypothetical protein